jgi:N6-adenosine-specific RNA methylase IME4
MKKAVLILLLITVAAPAEEVKKLSKCEIEYKKCEYECILKNPTSKNKQEGCKLRCAANKAYCETSRALKKAGKDIKDFFEGLLGYGED